MRCDRCSGGRIVGESCLNCGWEPGQAAERAVSERLEAGMKGLRARKQPQLMPKLTEMDRRNLAALRVDAAQMNRTP